MVANSAPEEAEADEGACEVEQAEDGGHMAAVADSVAVAEQTRDRLLNDPAVR